MGPVSIFAGFRTKPKHPHKASSPCWDLSVVKPLLGHLQPFPTNFISWNEHPRLLACLEEAPWGELQHLHGVAILYCLPGTRTSQSALLGLYPRIPPPGDNLLVNELLIVQQQLCPSVSSQKSAETTRKTISRWLKRDLWGELRGHISTDRALQSHCESPIISCMRLETNLLLF